MSQTEVQSSTDISHVLKCGHSVVQSNGKHFIPTSPTFLFWWMFISHLVFPVLFAPRATAVISARSVNGFASCVRFAVFLAVLYGFVKAHSHFTDLSSVFLISFQTHDATNQLLHHQLLCLKLYKERHSHNSSTSELLANKPFCR